MMDERTSFRISAFEIPEVPLVLSATRAQARARNGIDELYPIQQGIIELGNQNLNDISTQERTARIGFVPKGPIPVYGHHC